MVFLIPQLIMKTYYQSLESLTGTRALTHPISLFGFTLTELKNSLEFLQRLKNKNTMCLFLFKISQ